MSVLPCCITWYATGEDCPWRCDLHRSDGGVWHMVSDSFLEMMEQVSDFWAREMPEPVQATDKAGS